MKLIGLTGGVGMGKSTAAGFLLTSGARVVDTDLIARDLVQPGKPALAEIRRQFGDAILSSEGGLNRAALARLVFNDPNALKRLEAILHPRIRETWQLQVSEWRSTECVVGVVVIPLLFETQAEAFFERIFCVACSDATQNARLAQRGWSSEQIRQRIAAQLPIFHKMARADYVIWTEGSEEVHQSQIQRILQKL